MYTTEKWMWEPRGCVALHIYRQWKGGGGLGRSCDHIKPMTTEDLHDWHKFMPRRQLEILVTQFSIKVGAETILNPWYGRSHSRYAHCVLSRLRRTPIYKMDLYTCIWTEYQRGVPHKSTCSIRFPVLTYLLTSPHPPIVYIYMRRTYELMLPIVHVQGIK